jgi:hypothetical protein
MSDWRPGGNSGRVFLPLMAALALICGFAHELHAASTPQAHRHNSCAAVSPAPAFAPAPPGYQRQYNTIAHRLLDNEDGAGEAAVSPSMYAMLDTLLGEAQVALKPYPAGLSPKEAADFARSALLQIDCILLRHGFVYPGHGQVHLLSDGLAPTMYTDARALNELKAQPHNRRRQTFIAARGAGPFHVADCDTAAYIYLAIAEVMNYPLKLVDIPLHKFVRWEIDAAHWVDFETMDGFAADDTYYRRAWRIPARFEGRGGILRSMSAVETEGAYDALIAMAWSWRGDTGRMTALFERSMTRDTVRPLAANNLAWFYAAAPRLELRSGAKAVLYAGRAVAMLPDGENLDTLACAHAQNGDFAAAIRTEREAEKAGGQLSLASVRGNLALFARGKTCRDAKFGRDPAPFRPRAAGGRK